MESSSNDKGRFARRLMLLLFAGSFIGVLVVTGTAILMAAYFNLSVMPTVIIALVLICVVGTTIALWIGHTEAQRIKKEANRNRGLD